MALPFAVWLFLAIEQLPLAAEESIDPSRDMPRGIIAGLAHAVRLGRPDPVAQPVGGAGRFKLAASGEPLLDGFRATFGEGLAKLLALVACVGLIASFHTILFAKGRQIYSLSRAGYFPRFLSITHARHKTPYVALIAGSALALVIMFVLWFGMGAEKGAAAIQGMLLNMAVAGAMLSYLLQAVSFIVLRRRLPGLKRPYRSPLGIAGAVDHAGDRERDAGVPAPRSGVRRRRLLGRRLVRAGHHLVRPRRPEPPGAGAGGGVRDREVPRVSSAIVLALKRLREGAEPPSTFISSWTISGRRPISA